MHPKLFTVPFQCRAHLETIPVAGRISARSSELCASVADRVVKRRGCTHRRPRVVRIYRGCGIVGRRDARDCSRSHTRDTRRDVFSERFRGSERRTSKLRFSLFFFGGNGGLASSDRRISVVAITHRVTAMVLSRITVYFFFFSLKPGKNNFFFQFCHICSP